MVEGKGEANFYFWVLRTMKRARALRIIRRRTVWDHTECMVRALKGVGGISELKNEILRPFDGLRTAFAKHLPLTLSSNTP